jgi:hypothetical protein
MKLSTDVINKNFFNLIKSNFKFDIAKNLDNEELLPQEIHLKIVNKNINILRRHSFQDELRIKFFTHFLEQSLELINEDLNFEIIANLSEGIEDNLSIIRLCYSQKKGLNHIMIPDAHNFVTFEKILSLSSIDIEFDKKYDKAIFVGSDTGKIKNDFTKRSLFCKKFLGHEKIVANLTGGVRDEIKKSLVDFDKIHLNRYISIEEQLKYKLIVNIDGNSTSWERPLWAMASNSICLYVEPLHEHEFESWHYPLMELFGVIPKISIDNFDIFIDNDFSDNFWQGINYNQKIYAHTVGNLHNQKIYMANLVSYYNKKYNE